MRDYYGLPECEHATFTEPRNTPYKTDTAPRVIPLAGTGVTVRTIKSRFIMSELLTGQQLVVRMQYDDEINVCKGDLDDVLTTVTQVYLNMHALQ